MATHLGKRGYVEQPGNVTGLFIIIIIGAAVIFYALSITPAERADLGIEGYSRIALDVNPGTITGFVETEAITFSRKLSTTTVANTPEDSSKILSPSISASQSTTANNPATLEFETNPQNVADAVINFKIADKRGSGTLSVIVNGKTLKTTSGEIGDLVSVTIPLTLLKETNELEFIASNPGLAFWRPNIYVLKNIELIVQSFDAGSFTHKFDITTSELSGSGKVKLIAFVKSNGAEVPLTITLNGVELYKGLPSPDFELALPIKHLKTENKLVWSIERNGDYIINFPKIELTFSPVNSEKIYDFNIATNEFTSMNLGRFECKLTIHRGELFGFANINVNSARVRVNFNEANLFSDDICEHLQQGTNTITISSDNDIIIDRLQVAIKEKQ